MQIGQAQRMTAFHHPADINHVTSHKINRNKNITVVAHGHSLMVNRDVLCKTAVAWSGITFPLFAVLSQHMGSRSLHPNKCPNHNPQQDTTGDWTRGYIGSKMTMSWMMRPNLCTKGPTKRIPYHILTLRLERPDKYWVFWLAYCQLTFQSRHWMIVSKAENGEILDHHISLWHQQTHTSTGKIPNHSLYRRHYMPSHNTYDDQWWKLHHRLGNIKGTQTPFSWTHHNQCC